jgi:hypothetical protein
LVGQAPRQRDVTESLPRCAERVTRAAQDVRMKSKSIGIRFLPAHGAADLEVMLPADEWAESSVWKTLANLGIHAESSYLVRAGERLIVRARLSEDGGAPLGQARAAEVLDGLRAALTPRRTAVSTIRPPRESGRQLTPAA